MLEAAAAKLRIVAYPSSIGQICTATEEIFDSHPGFVVYAKQYSAESLANAIKTALHSGTGISDDSYKAFVSDYSWRHALVSLEAYYDSLQK